MNAGEKKALALLMLLEMVFFGVYGLGTIEYWKKPQSDLYDIFYYRSMAYSSPQVSHEEIKPFGYRILPPLLAGMMPFDVDANYTILMALSLLFLVASTYGFLLHLGISRSTSFLVTVFFMFNRYFHTFFIWDQFQLTDTYTMILVVWMLWSLDARRMKAFAFLLVAGAFIKAANLMMIPAAIAYHRYRRRFDKEQMKWLILGSVIALASAGAIRMLISTQGGKSLLEAFLAYAPVKLTGANWIFRTFINHFLPFTLIPVIYPRRTAGFIKKYPDMTVYGILILISSFFGDNCERLIAPAAIVLYSLLALIIDREIKKRAGANMILATLMISAFLVSFHPYMGILRATKTQMYAILAVTTIASTGAALLQKIRYKPKSSSAAKSHE